MSMFLLTLFYGDFFLTERKSKKQQKWTTPERNLVKSAFDQHITKGELPKKHECEKFLNDNATAMANRSWKNVKDFVRNLEQKLNKRL